MITVVVRCGASPKPPQFVIHDLCDAANQLGMALETEVNGIFLIVQPLEDPRVVLARWQSGAPASPPGKQDPGPPGGGRTCPGHPKGAGSKRVEYRVTDAQYAELKREGRGNANAAAKARTFPAGPSGGAGDSKQKET